MKLPYRSKCFGYIGFVMAIVVMLAMLMSTGFKAHQSPTVANAATMDNYDKPDLPAQPATVNLHQCSTIGDNPPNCWNYKTNTVSKIDSLTDTAGINTYSGQPGRDWERIL